MTTTTSPQQPLQSLKRLARKIAKAFKDDANYRFYLAYCQRYPLKIIWRAFIEVQHVPPERIRKSKGALFNYLVQKYAKEYQELIGTQGDAGDTTDSSDTTGTVENPGR
jgi:hypothetical protein